MRGSFARGFFIVSTLIFCLGAAAPVFAQGMSGSGSLGPITGGASGQATGAVGSSPGTGGGSQPGAQPGAAASGQSADTTPCGTQTPAQTQESAPTTLTLSIPVGGVSVVSSLPQYILLWYRYAIGICGLAATIMAVYGGFRYLMGSSSGDIGAGKKIIEDAIAGMLIVLGAYVILYNISPATTQLRMPDINAIRPCNPNLGQFQTSANFGEAGQRCIADADCGNGGTCMLFDAQPTLLRAILFEAAQRTGAMQNGAEMGRCSTGAENEACRCSGQGCLATNDAVGSVAGTVALTYPRAIGAGVGQAYDNIANAQGVGATAWAVVSSPASYLSGAWGSISNSMGEVRLEMIAPRTNSGGSGARNCQSGLTCTYLPNSGAMAINWKCQRANIRGASVYTQYVEPAPIVRCITTQGIPQSMANALGMTTTEGRTPGGCASDEVCIRWDPSAGASMGYCSKRDAATQGQVCKCSGWGCRPQAPGWAVTTQCAQGLNCDLVKSDDSTGLHNYYYCVPPDTSTPAPREGDPGFIGPPVGP